MRVNLTHNHINIRNNNSIDYVNGRLLQLPHCTGHRTVIVNMKVTVIHVNMKVIEVNVAETHNSAG